MFPADVVCGPTGAKLVALLHLSTRTLLGWAELGERLTTGRTPLWGRNIVGSDGERQDAHLPSGNNLLVTAGMSR